MVFHQTGIFEERGIGAAIAAGVFVPFAIAGTNVVADAQQTYDERSAAAADLEFDPGWRLMEYFLSAECGVQSAE